MKEILIILGVFLISAGALKLIVALYAKWREE